MTREFNVHLLRRTTAAPILNNIGDHICHSLEQLTQTNVARLAFIVLIIQTVGRRPIYDNA